MKPNFIEDGVLHPNICINKPLSLNLNAPKAIFITGVTGFIGAFLLDELIRQTTATLYCLVRGNKLAILKRFKLQLQFYGLWQPNYFKRIILINGDLSQPYLGLSILKFHTLAEKIDIIYHSAALMNPLDSYSRMRNINVLGTHEIIRLAALSQTKPIHYLSTLGVFSNSYNHLERKLTETELPLWNKGLSSGYSQSKWVAEKLLREAKVQGLPVCLYRPDIVLGHSQTGVTSPAGHFLYNVILASIQCGKVPFINTMINFVSVDYVSRAISYLSMQQNVYGKTFHLNNPQSISWQQLWVKIAALGYSIEEVTYAQWRTAIITLSIKEPDNIKLASVCKRLQSGKPIYLFSTKPTVAAKNTHQGLRDSDIVCSPINEKLLSVYLNYFLKIG